MLNKSFIGLTFLFVFLATAPFSNASSSKEVSALIPSNFVFFSNGSLTCDEIRCADESKYIWSVSNENGRLKILPYDYLTRKRPKVIIPYQIKMKFSGLKLTPMGGESRNDTLQYPWREWWMVRRF